MAERYFMVARASRSIVTLFVPPLLSGLTLSRIPRLFILAIPTSLMGGPIWLFLMMIVQSPLPRVGDPGRFPAPASISVLVPSLRLGSARSNFLWFWFSSLSVCSVFASSPFLFCSYFLYVVFLAASFLFAGSVRPPCTCPFFLFFSCSLVPGAV